MGPRLRGLFVTLYGWFRAKEYAPPAKRGSISCPFCCGGLLADEVTKEGHAQQHDSRGDPKDTNELDEFSDVDDSDRIHNGRKAPFEGHWLITSQSAGAHEP